MVCLLLHGVVLSLARSASLAFPCPRTKARIRLTVPSFESRIRHVRSPALCVPILSCLRVHPPQEWAAVMFRMPHTVSPSLPEIGHHLYLRVVKFWTSFPTWNPKTAPTRMSSSKSSGSRF